MPGVPKSQACRHCKARKVRCDLNWPTCGRCKRANKVCPGPATMFKWVEDSGSPPETSDLSASIRKRTPPPQPVNDTPRTSSAREDPLSIVSINSRCMAGGGSYGLFRLASTPKPNPTTAADRTAAQLVRILDGPKRVALRAILYFEVLPNRLTLSSALRDCVALFCSAWIHIQRGGGAHDLMDHIAEPYGKAMRSVQRAINESREQLRVETLAAISVLERFDVLFNVARKPHRTLHGQGICGIMRSKGPPDLDDDLDIRLSLECQEPLMAHWLADGGENFLLEKEWSEALEASRQKLIEKDSYHARLFDLERLMHDWPAKVEESYYIQANFDDPHISLRIHAHLDRLEDLQQKNEIVGGNIIDESHELGLIRVVESATCPGGYAYDFSGGQLFELLFGYYIVKLILLTMTIDISVHEEDISTITYRTEISHVCRGICMLGPYIQQLGPVATTLYLHGFIAVWAMGTKEESDYCMELILLADRSRQRIPRDPVAGATRLKAIFAGMVGQKRFPVYEDERQKEKVGLWEKEQDQEL